MKVVKNNNNKKGLVSMEMIFGTFALLMVCLLLLGFYTYTYPRSVLEKEVHILGQQAKITGGLSQQQITEFKAVLADFGYAAEVSAYVGDGRGGSVTVIGVAPRNTPYADCTGGRYTPFVKRESGQKIVIDVRITADDGLVKGPLKWLSAQALPENYILTEVTLSERNRC